MSLEDKLYPFLSLYDQLPQKARNFIGAAYRRLPRRIRHGGGGLAVVPTEVRILADDQQGFRSR